MPKVSAAVKLAAVVNVHLHGSSLPQHGRGEKQWCNKVASHTVSKLLHQAGAPSAG